MFQQHRAVNGRVWRRGIQGSCRWGYQLMDPACNIKVIDLRVVNFQELKSFPRCRAYCRGGIFILKEKNSTCPRYQMITPPQYYYYCCCPSLSRGVKLDLLPINSRAYLCRYPAPLSRKRRRPSPFPPSEYDKTFLSSVVVVLWSF